MPPLPVYIADPPQLWCYIDLYLEKKTQLMGALHAACLKSAADGPGAGRYADFSGARRRLQKWPQKVVFRPKILSPIKIRRNYLNCSNIFWVPGHFLFFGAERHLSP